MRIVVLAWTPASRCLQYVPVNDGDGGGVETSTVADWYVEEFSRHWGDGTRPRLGYLERDGEDCLVELGACRVTRCRPSWKGNQVRLVGEVGGRQGVMAQMSPPEVGLPDDTAVLDGLGSSAGEYLLFDSGQPKGCWVIEGGITAWASRRQAALQTRQEERAGARERGNQRREREQQQLRWHDPERFVNPYTFVPFPEDIVRSPPSWHTKLADDHLSGTLTVRWELTAPMQAPPGAVDGHRLRVPGASVKGAVRSLHETLAGGCLRVLDETFVPSYRDPARSPQQEAALASDHELTLASVTEVTHDGQPLSVQVASQVVWVRGPQLRDVYGKDLRTGSRVRFDAPATPTSLGRFELHPDASVDRADGSDEEAWTVLLSDPSARPTTRNDGSKSQYFAACGRLTGDRVEVSESAWRTYRKVVAGAREVVQARSADVEPPRWVPVKFDGKPIGERQRVTGRFAVGDVLWVRQRGEQVVELRHAVIWRHLGAGPLGKRVPSHLRACPHDFDGDDTSLLLCPSCRLFGAADTTTRPDDGPARQCAYAGHVRFGDALSPAPVQLQQVSRAPMGAPRPGAGQFYLALQNTRPARSGRYPTREWGAEPDQNSLRPVRGRKFYWHTEPSPSFTSKRHERRPHHRAQMVSEHLLAPPGTVLHQRITFDNLDQATLGGLLAALQPEAVLPAVHRDGQALPIRLHLGGGRPLGLGSCTATVTEVRAWDADSRYGGGPAVTLDRPQALAAFTASCPEPVRDGWPALASVLSAGKVNPARVTYPPGENWPEDVTAARTQQFDKPFDFFTMTSGMYLAEEEPRPLLPLPDPTAGDQSLPILRKKKSR
ncbi:RAMP superfamily CRISPR-associated protein [Mangrovihabitans endophyticus]|uniref:CRISPR-associated protein n=1 Tax=Mangrovihabitans endophyticus TaxID=1751298 RepID=A0A8J3C4V4_9ACTN|nr:RAMP superfamily CRISPR-associated protein [Mangrovihabitans endophyticus]GGL19394.1 hypothetical protein GCM10012284_62420 [Mangrovihabitans endophyticus]